MAINKTYFAENSVKLEDIQKALATSHAQDALRYASGGFLKKPEINPCSELILINTGVECWKPGPRVTRVEGGSISGDFIQTGKINVGYKNSYEVDFDESVWTIEVPGIAKDRIEVFQVSDVVYVRIDKDKTKQITRFLDKEEVIKSTKLDLGILTIVIDRPNKRQDIEIG